MPVKYYYFVEDIDVTNDNIPDGVLVRQFKVNQIKKSYIYTKNNYISHHNLQNILNDITDTDDTNMKKHILVSNTAINQIKNKHMNFTAIPRVIISKSSHFAHMLKNKNIDMKKLVSRMNKLFA